MTQGAVIVLGGRRLAGLHLQPGRGLLVVLCRTCWGHEEGRGRPPGGEQDVLAGLGHPGRRWRRPKDRAIHQGVSGSHVLDVVSVPGGVDERVLALVGLVLDVRVVMSTCADAPREPCRSRRRG